MDVLTHLTSRQTALISFLRQLVECESPSDDPAAVNRFQDLFASSVADIARVKKIRGGSYGDHLLCEFHLPGPRRKKGQVMALGHADTVWPMGTLKSMPWREAEGRLWGPGVLDMKAGLAFFVFAMRALRDLEIPVAQRVLLQINSDEEVGSHSSRPLTEKNALASDIVLVLEPGQGLAGKLKTARKGVGSFHMAVEGISSHAGLDIAAGASAIEELAWQIEKIRPFTDLGRGITVNVGVVRGGTRVNVVPARASADIDFRIPRLRDYAALQKKFAALKPRDKRCKLVLTGELNRPPFERTPAVAALFRKARRIARRFAIDLAESATGGGSDGNFTGALGVPTLDGLGAVGEGAHAVNESILTGRIADRTALMAALVAEGA